METHRWGLGRSCPYAVCGWPRTAPRRDRTIRREAGSLYRCGRCGREFTVTVGTVLHATRIPLSIWVRAARWFAEEKAAGRSRRQVDLIGAFEISRHCARQIHDEISRVKEPKCVGRRLTAERMEELIWNSLLGLPNSPGTNWPRRTRTRGSAHEHVNSGTQAE